MSNGAEGTDRVNQASESNQFDDCSGNYCPRDIYEYDKQSLHACL